ncbi:hypothetical protein F2Q70_00019927 [Brassica cretica]|uniref:PGG domain-containing protein n=1 Tax=Brassica cretica TaxID=69181 RepID=A0A8S9GL33_BRACR|nr:hypothetical protein F2Q70_00019927 [Brassica cretica]
MRRLRSNTSDEARAVFLIVCTLIITATYQTALQPPGGVHQPEEDANAGSVVMKQTFFILLWVSNTVGFCYAILYTFCLMPIGSMFACWFFWIGGSLCISYALAMAVISPHPLVFISMTFAFFLLFALYLLSKIFFDNWRKHLTVGLVPQLSWRGKAVRLLLECRLVKRNDVNGDGLTFLDILRRNQERREEAGGSQGPGEEEDLDLEQVVVNTGCKEAASVPRSKAQYEIYKSPLTFWTFCSTFMRRLRSNTSDEARAVFLIVCTLIITATYQTALQPPGGVHQPEEDVNAGSAVMKHTFFILLWVSNTVGFCCAILYTFCLLPLASDCGSCAPIELVSEGLIPPTYFTFTVLLTEEERGF